MEVTCRDSRIALDRTSVDRLVAMVEAGEGRDLPVSLLVVDDGEIRRINREFLDHDDATDVITFDLSGEGDDSLCGEIVVSAECAERIARELGNDPAAELLFYVCHGLLHLCGYDDAGAHDRARMLERQRDYLRRLGLDVRV